ncbi:MAG: GAF domain-containing sensor histidine kinase [Trebonia sp.]|jgi:signal transduction histidine kinase
MTAPGGDHGPVAGGAGAADAAGGLGFPDVPRLELDELLVQLVDRASGVLAAQGRLRGLLRANALVAGDLSLPVVLRQIVGAARDLLGARYAALGVLGRDGELEQFVHAGMDDNLVAAIGDLPRGRGILGLLISEPAPIRLADLGAHPAAAGFPPGHPPMGSFVGVPVRIGEEIFGNLYLTERTAGGEFTADDEELAIALAAAAGAAIANARRYAESEQRRRWLDASAQLTPLLLADNRERPHTLITAHAAEAADADFAVLAVPGDPDRVIVTGAVGALTAGLLSRTAPVDGSLAGQVISSGKPSLITGDRLEGPAAALAARIGPLIAVPLAAGERVLGALMLGRRAARPGFTELDLGMAASFAGHAAVAMELAQARADQILLAQAEDHDRIAGDLHDQVIQALFALGMKLQGQAARSDPAAAERVNGYVDTVDEVIRDIRASIFGLRQPHQAPAGLQARVLEIIDEHAPQLGFTADASFTLPDGSDPDENLAHDILAVTREALSNCARHAHASTVTITLTHQDGLITLEITDNGRGLGTPARSSGLASMRRRAENNGGTLQITAPACGGTRLTWTARPRQ